jgi:hypothetical protein
MKAILQQLNNLPITYIRNATSRRLAAHRHTPENGDLIYHHKNLSEAEGGTTNERQ